MTEIGVEEFEDVNEIQECRVYDHGVWCRQIDYTLFLKHQKAYVLAAEAGRGKNVLDFGCGSGYGTEILSKSVASVIGVDASPVAIKEAQSRYSAQNLTFQKINPDYTLPFEDNTFDLVTSFQVIEHIPDVSAYLRLLKRVLKPGGKLYITTPNRKFRLLPFQKIWQPAHEREYTAEQLRGDLGQVFDKFELKGIHGTDPFDAIYIAHYKQTPFKAYVRQPLRDALRSVLPKSVYTKWRDGLGLQQKTSKTPLPQSELDRFSLDSVLVDDDLSKALDFLAIGTK